MLFERRYRFSLRFAALFVGDVFCLLVAIGLAAWVRLGLDEGLIYLAQNQMALTILVLIGLLVFYIGGLYERSMMADKSGILMPSLACVAISHVLLIVLFYAQFELLIGRGVLLLIGLFTWLLITGLRYLFRAIAGYSFFVKNALVVGEGKDAGSIMRLINGTDEHNYRLLGVVTHTKGKAGDLIETVPVIGQIGTLRDLVKHYRIETLIVATSLAREQKLLKVLRPLRYSGIEILDYASFYEQIAEEIPLDHIDDEWLMHAAMNSSRIHILKLKRIMDVLVSAIGLIVTVPICFVTTIAIRLDSPGPIFYRQKRAGLDGAIFEVLKFRTMVEDAETGTGAVWAGKNDARVTRVGRFLRKTRIDEIPQLLNVLRGHMSLVGPRPERPEFIKELSNTVPFYRERLMVAPGITGWAQVNFPYAASIQASRRKLQFDLYYIKHMSLLLDTLILLRTFKTILVGLRHSEDDSAHEPAVEKKQPKLEILEHDANKDSSTSRTA